MAENSSSIWSYFTGEKSSADIISPLEKLANSELSQKFGFSGFVESLIGFLKSILPAPKESTAPSAETETNQSLTKEFNRVEEYAYNAMGLVQEALGEGPHAQKIQKLRENLKTGETNLGESFKTVMDTSIENVLLPNLEPDSIKSAVASIFNAQNTTSPDTSEKTFADLSALGEAIHNIKNPQPTGQPAPL